MVSDPDLPRPRNLQQGPGGRLGLGLGRGGNIGLICGPTGGLSRDRSFDLTIGLAIGLTISLAINLNAGGWRGRRRWRRRLQAGGFRRQFRFQTRRKQDHRAPRPPEIRFHLCFLALLDYDGPAFGIK